MVTAARIKDLKERTQRKRSCENGGLDWYYAAINEGMPAVIRSWKRQRKNFP
jgi:hypothetical protein